jgi:hypothetical protein
MMIWRIMMMSEYKANDIYERLEMQANGESGSVEGDISEMLMSGDTDALDDYFGDTDPTEYL